VFDVRAVQERASSLAPAVWNGAQADGSHGIFMLTNVPGPEGAHHPGIDSLIRYMGEGGLDFYKSQADYPGGRAYDGYLIPARGAPAVHRHLRPYPLLTG
jgi:hypothetical protein